MLMSMHILRNLFYLTYSSSSLVLSIHICQLTDHTIILSANNIRKQKLFDAL